MRVFSLADPAIDYSAVTPSDTTDLTQKAKGLYIGGAGDVTVFSCQSAAGTAVTFKAVPVGTTLNVQVWRVKATGTTATNIVALY